MATDQLDKDVYSRSSSKVIISCGKLAFKTNQSHLKENIIYYSLLIHLTTEPSFSNILWSLPPIGGHW